MKKIPLIILSIIFCMHLSAQNMKQCITTRLVNFEESISNEYKISRASSVINNLDWKKINQRVQKRSTADVKGWRGY